MGKVDNVGVAVRISLISHPVSKMQCTSGLPSSVLTSGSQAFSVNVRLCRNVVIESEIVDIVGVPFRILPIYRPTPKFQ